MFLVMIHVQRDGMVLTAVWHVSVRMAQLVLLNQDSVSVLLAGWEMRVSGIEVLVFPNIVSLSP